MLKCLLVTFLLTVSYKWYDIRSHRSNWEIHKHCIVNGVSHWKWQVSVRIKTGSVCSYCSLLQLKLGEVISQGNRKVGSFCRYRITKESKESNKRFLLGTLLFKLEINSLPYVNLPEGTYGRNILSFGSPHVELRFYCQIHTGDTRLTPSTRRLEGNLVKGICAQETEFTVAKIGSSTLRPLYTAKLGLGWNIQFTMCQPNIRYLRSHRYALGDTASWILLLKSRSIEAILKLCAILSYDWPNEPSNKKTGRNLSKG